MKSEICVILGLFLVVSILGCVTTSRYIYEKEIVFDELSYKAWGARVVDGVEIYQVDLRCRAINNNKTHRFDVEYQAFITYTVAGIGQRTQRGELEWVDLGPDDTQNLKVIIDIYADPSECTEFTYGFTYGGLVKGYLNRTIHPKRS